MIKTVPLGASVRWLSNEQRPFDGRFIWTYEVAGGRMGHGEPVGSTVNVLVIDPWSWAIVERSKSHKSHRAFDMVVQATIE